MVFVAAWLIGASVALAAWAVVAIEAERWWLCGCHGAHDGGNGGLGFGDDGDNSGHGMRMGIL